MSLIISRKGELSGVHNNIEVKWLNECWKNCPIIHGSIERALYYIESQIIDRFLAIFFFVIGLSTAFNCILMGLLSIRHETIFKVGFRLERMGIGCVHL